MKVTLIEHQSSGVIPTGITLQILAIKVGERARLHDPNDSEGLYITSVVEEISIVADTISIKTKNSYYEFEVV